MSSVQSSVQWPSCKVDGYLLAGKYMSMAAEVTVGEAGEDTADWQD